MGIIRIKLIILLKIKLLKIILKEKNNKKNVLKYLNEIVKTFKVKAPTGVPRMSSMLVGYFSYDIIRLIEKIPINAKMILKYPT